jgi:xylulokinase
LLDGLDAVRSAQNINESIDVIGGGAKSTYWLQMLADVFDVPIDYRAGGEVGPALGAARLAAIGYQGQEVLSEVCTKPALIKRYLPNQTGAARYAEKRERFQALYQRLKGL